MDVTPISRVFVIGKIRTIKRSDSPPQNNRYRKIVRARLIGMNPRKERDGKNLSIRSQRGLQEKMIPTIVTGCVLAILIVATAGKIRVGLELENLEGTLSVRYLLFSKRFSLKKSEDKSEKKGKEEKSGKSQKGSFPLNFVKILPDYFPAARKFLELFNRYGKVVDLGIRGELGTGDPYLTGLGYGLLESLGQSTKNLVPRLKFSLTPNFTEEVYKFNARGKGEIRTFLQRNSGLKPGA